MPDADVNRLNSVPRSQRQADQLPVVLEWGGRAALQTGHRALSDQHALGTAYARPIDEHAQMSRQAKPTRMSDPLTIKQERIGRAPKTTNRFLTSKGSM